MQLPNFLDDAALNELRSEMGTKELGTFRLSVNAYRFTVRELEQLIVDGIDIKYLDEVRALPDGTLGYKDRRVLLYAREVTPVAGGAAPPAYHVSNCAAVRRMREQIGFARHAVCAREDGNFQVTAANGTQTQVFLQRLPVCEHCLAELGFDNSPAAFAVPHFFEKYRRNLLIDNQEPGETTGRFAAR